MIPKKKCHVFELLILFFESLKIFKKIEQNTELVLNNAIIQEDIRMELKHFFEHKKQT